MRSCERANETSARGGALCGDVVGGSRLPGSCHRRRLRAVAVPVGLSRCRMCTQSPACFSPPFMETASGGTVRWPVRDAGRALASFSPRSPAKRAFAAARPWRDARLHAASSPASPEQDDPGRPCGLAAHATMAAFPFPNAKQRT
jgi:hypothetical protein